MNYLINKDTYELTFIINLELNGGVCEVDYVIAKLGLEVSIPNPSRSGYSFGGWYKNVLLTDVYTTSYITKLYAKWN